MKHMSCAQIEKKLLLTLLKRGKTGRTHTTPIENLHGSALPPHQKKTAKVIIENMVKAGILCARPSQGRKHVYLSPLGIRSALALRS